MTHYINCPVCNSPQLVFFMKCNDFLVTGKEYELYRCSDCNFILTQDHPEEKEIGSFYQSQDYISHSDAQKGLFNSLYHLVRKLMLKRKMSIVKNVSGLNRGTILDIGSGTGYFASTMKKAGWNVSGVEVNDAAREFSIKKFGLNIIPSGEINNIPSYSYDCITLWHVLEHLENPVYYLKEIDRLLKPGGICLVALPNWLSFDAKYYKQFWAAYDVPRHLWHFNPDSIHRLAERYQFNIIEKIPLPFDSYYISILSEKNRQALFPVIQGFFTGFKSNLISLFQQEKNSSLIYVLKKQ
jgi:2-polyprenyl-3-methyl-5-hydroxy-6-metoxy-1,4-benzoquinol methylase